MDENEAKNLADKSALDASDYALMAKALPLSTPGEYRWLANKNVLQFYMTNESKCSVNYINSL